MTAHAEHPVDEFWLVRARGRVQGVGYRDACVQYASGKGIRGWVHNRVDGTVELTLQGSADKVEAMLEWLRHSVRGAHVTALDSTQLHEPVERFDGFKRLPTL